MSILNLNDFRPYFVQDQFEFNVTENQNNITAGQVVAADGDSGAYGALTFSIEDNKHLNITEDGIIFVKKSFDRETDPVFSTTVSVTDAGSY